jgi:uncharacterized protein (DUF362 family)
MKKYKCLMKKVVTHLFNLSKRNFEKRIAPKILFLVFGLASTAWFLIRVLPKPQRATYPCMRAAAPVMSGFIIYLLTLTGSLFSYQKAKTHFLKGKYLVGSLFAVAAIIAGMVFFTEKTQQVYARATNSTSIRANEPIGIARGISPGLVAWIHNPGAAKWDGTTGKWFDDTNVSQEKVFRMMSKALISVTGEKTESAAWHDLFVHFNKTKKNSSSGYREGQKVAIKINENNTSSHSNSDELNASPQMVLALVTSLVNDAKVPQKNITVFDASRFVTDNVYNKVHSAFPDLIIVDNVGGDGRVKSSYVENAIPYSEDNGKLAKGLASCAVEADYLINMALLKGHVGQGVTLCAKNYYGVTSIFNDWHLNAHNNFNQDMTGKPKYMTLTDYLGHKDLGEKTMLFLIDGLYGSKLVNGPPMPKWQMQPFNNDWACSLLASQDGVAIDAVGLDFLRNEWPDAPDMSYSDQYLVEAALADNPPSKTFYDPEQDKTRCKSLGVMEHWNNAKDKQYSRNLGKGQGIKLLYLPIK